MSATKWDWRTIQERAARSGEDDWATCPACGEEVLQGVGSLHVTEEHPEIALNIANAARKGHDD